jgi:hypothetical protein
MSAITKHQKLTCRVLCPPPYTSYFPAPMAASQFHADLTHVQTFMASQAATLGDTADKVMAAQFRSFMNRLDKMQPLTPEDASNINAAVCSGPWTQEQRGQMCSKVALKLVTAETSQTHSRRSCQEIRTFGSYLTSDEKSIIQDPASSTASKISAVCQRCYLIGLDIPSETSIRHIVSVVCALSSTQTDNDHEFLYSVVMEFKRWMKSLKNKTSTPPCGTFISQYPASPNDLPQTIIDHAYKSARPCDPDDIAANVNVIESRVPLRRSSKHVRAVVPATASGHQMPSPTQVLQMVSSLFGAVGLNVPQPACRIQYLNQSNPIPPPTHSSTPALPAMLTHAGMSTQDPPSLSMDNTNTTASPAPLAIADVHRADVPQMKVKDQMDAFMTAHQERRDAGAQHVGDIPVATTPPAKKKPAASAKSNAKSNTKGARAKPCKPKASPKSKASNVKAKSKSWHSTVQNQISKEQWKQAVGGCGKCRYSPFCTPSCWRSRGVQC